MSAGSGFRSGRFRRGPVRTGGCLHLRSMLRRQRDLFLSMYHRPVLMAGSLLLRLICSRGHTYRSMVTRGELTVL